MINSKSENKHFSFYKKSILYLSVISKSSFLGLIPVGAPSLQEQITRERGSSGNPFCLQTPYLKRYQLPELIIWEKTRFFLKVQFWGSPKCVTGQWRRRAKYGTRVWTLCPGRTLWAWALDSLSLGPALYLTLWPLVELLRGDWL